MTENCTYCWRTRNLTSEQRETYPYPDKGHQLLYDVIDALLKEGAET